MNIFSNRSSICTLLFIAIVIISSLSCTNRKEVPAYSWALDSVKQEVLTNPSRVTASYDSMMSVIGASSDRVSREFQLYLLLAKRRQNEPCTNDSLAEILVEEFTSSNPLLKSMALFIHGVTYLEQGAPERALEELYKAKDVAGIKEHTRQYVRVCLTISIIYFDKGLYNLALPLKFEAIEYTKQARDTSYLSHSYRDIANIYEVMSKSDSAAIFYQKALTYARLSGNKRAQHHFDIDYARFLLMHDSLGKAKGIMDTMLVPKRPNIMAVYNANKLRRFYLEKKYDSCVYYCRLLAKDPDPAGRLMGYGYEYSCGLRTKNTAVALDALQQYTNLNDSIFNIHKVEQIRKVRNKYDYLLAEHDKIIAEKQFRYVVAAIVGLALLLIAVLFYTIQKQKIYNLKRESIMRARLKLRHLRYEKSAQSFQDKQQEVESLKYQLDDVINKESSTEIELIRARKELAEMNMRLKTVEMTSSVMEEKSFKKSPALRKIVDAINNQEYAELELEDWKEFQAGCQKAYPSLFAVVSQFGFSMSADELKICYLTKLGVTPTEISRLLFKSPSAVSKNKVRMYTKLMNKSGKTADFDALIDSL